jgi:hypothetical protein
MPARPRTALAVAALATLAGLVAGCGSTTSSDSSATPLATATATAAATSPAADASPTTPAASTGSAATATASAAPSTSPAGSATASAAARPWVADPWNKGYEFGFVWGAKRSGNAVALTFDPAGMLLGKQAKAYYDAHPNEERFDFKILNDRSFTQTLRVPASATLYGNQRLGARASQNERITLDRLVARASGGDRQKVAVWLKRGSSGAVVYLAEQYLP